MADAEAVRFHQQSFHRLITWLVAERKGAVVHGDEDFRSEVHEGPHGLLGVHVDIAATRGFVCADGHQGDVDRMAFTDLTEAVEVGAIAAMEDGFSASFDDVAAVVPVGIMDESRAPVVRRSVDNFELIEVQRVPNLHLMDGGKIEALDQRRTSARDNDALPSLQDFKAGLVEMIEMGVRDEHEIHLGKTSELQSRLALAFHRAVPLCPIRIYDHRVPGELQEKRGVAYPCDPHFVIHRWREDWLQHIAVRPPEHAGDDAVAQKAKIAARPSFVRE